MSYLNLLVHINSYEDSNDTNNPSQSQTKWTFDKQKLDCNEPFSQILNLAAGESKELFSGAVALLNTPSSYDLVLIDSSTYRLISSSNGTFRAFRSNGSDATTVAQVVKNGNVLTISSISGTAFSLVSGGVVVNDSVRLGVGFNSANQGVFKLLARTATSFSFENPNGVEESVTLGADFLQDIEFYGKDGVQVGESTKIIAGFSSSSFGAYSISDVNHNYLEFNTTEALAEESAISSSPVPFIIYNNLKKFLYIESNKSLSISINGNSETNTIEPMNLGINKIPGILLNTGSVYSCSIVNNSEESAKIYFATCE